MSGSELCCCSGTSALPLMQKSQEEASAFKQQGSRLGYSLEKKPQRKKGFVIAATAGQCFLPDPQVRKASFKEAEPQLCKNL